MKEINQRSYSEKATPEETSLPLSDLCCMHGAGLLSSFALKPEMFDASSTCPGFLLVIFQDTQSDQNSIQFGTWGSPWPRTGSRDNCGPKFTMADWKETKRFSTRNNWPLHLQRFVRNCSQQVCHFWHHPLDQRCQIHHKVCVSWNLLITATGLLSRSPWDQTI